MKKKEEIQKSAENIRESGLWKKLWKLWITLCSVELSFELCKLKMPTKYVENNETKRASSGKSAVLPESDFWEKWQIKFESGVTLSKNLQVGWGEYTSYYLAKKFAGEKPKIVVDRGKSVVL